MNCSSNKAQTNIVGLQAEGDIQANRSDFQVMQDRQNLFHKGLMVMERQIKEQEMSCWWWRSRSRARTASTH
eukprot:scaffold27683_cov21-Tisochrysis_lutea.AAC.3